MNRTEAARHLTDILDALDVHAGDTVFLTVDMGRVPLPRYEAPLTRAGIAKRERAWCSFVVDSLRDRLGSRGTILCPTFSYDYARNGTPYVHETSASETGPLTEHIRTLPGALRSLHPLNSIAGIGRHAEAILRDAGKAGYGAMSPFARLTAYDAKAVMLGTTVGRALVHAHHLEHMYGVNHMYHKLYSVPVMCAGKEVLGPWLCFVRYLGVGVEPQIANLEARLREEGVLREYPPSPHPMQCVAIAEVERIGYAMLRETSFAFLRDPIAVHVDSPGAFDQPSRGPAVRFARTA